MDAQLASELNVAARGSSTLSQRLRQFLYLDSRIGITLDTLQALLSFVECGLFVLDTYSDPTLGVRTLEVAINAAFLLDVLLRGFLASDRLHFMFSFMFLIDYLTIVPSIVSVSVLDGSPGASASLIEVLRCAALTGVGPH